MNCFRAAASTAISAGMSSSFDTTLRLVRRRLQFLLELLYLRANDGPAVRLVGIGAVVILVIILSRVKLLQRHNFGDDRLAEMLLRLGF